MSFSSSLHATSLAFALFVPSFSSPVCATSGQCGPHATCTVSHCATMLYTIPLSIEKETVVMKAVASVHYFATCVCQQEHALCSTVHVWGCRRGWEKVSFRTARVGGRHRKSTCLSDIHAQQNFHADLMQVHPCMPSCRHTYIYIPIPWGRHAGTSCMT